jgi:hypothetical protein
MKVAWPPFDVLAPPALGLYAQAISAHGERKLKARSTAETIARQDFASIAAVAV